MLKLAVGVVLALWAWTYYVYVARFCVGLIRGGDGGEKNRAMGSECLAWLSLA